MATRNGLMLAATIALMLAAPARSYASLIAYTAPGPDGGTDIYVVDETGGTPTNLTNAAGSDWHPVWSPDGTQIAFESDRAGSSGIRDIYVMDASGGNLRNVSQSSVTGEEMSWSPDSRFLVCRTDSGSDIWILNVDYPWDQVNLTQTAGTSGGSGPSWSPDGEWIAFRSSGAASNISAMRADGSDVVDLTSVLDVPEGVGTDMWPVWSPDGTRIAFASDRNSGSVEVMDIWVMDIVADQAGVISGVNHLQLTTDPAQDNYPSWSPDGSEILFWTNRATSGLWAVASDGLSPARDLAIPDTGSTPAYPSWQPTSVVAVVSRFLDFGAVLLNSVSPPQSFVVTNGTATTLTVSDIASDSADFSASPSAFSLAPGGLQTVDVALTPAAVGWRPATLTVTHDGGPAEVFRMQGIGSMAAPTGDLEADTKIVFASNADGDWDIYTVNPDGSGLQNRTNDSSDTDWRPRWSPDGSQIVFQSDRDLDLDFDIYTMDADGSNVFNVTQDTEGAPAASDRMPDWSPDGSKIVFVSDRGTDLDIYTIDSAGLGPVIPLTGGQGNHSGPVWSPDGSQIAFSRGPHDIWRMDSGGGNEFQLSYGTTGDEEPAWSPDGLSILFGRKVPGGKRLFTVDAAVGERGAPAVEYTTDGYNEYPQWSPDGAEFVFYRDGDVQRMVATPGAVPALVSTGGTMPAWSPFLTVPVGSDIAVTPAPLDIGSVGVGSSGTGTLTIASTGTATLTVSAITSDDQAFVVSASPARPFDLLAEDPDLTQDVIVTFTPTVEGAQSANITITHNAAGGSTVVTATGTGAAAATGAATVTVADAQGQLGGTTTVAIDITDVTGLDVAAVELILTYDGAIVTPLNDGTNTTAAATTALVPADWSLEQNVPAPGELRIALAGPSASPIAGGGTMVQATFDVLPTATIGATSPLTLTTASLNEGVVTSTSVAGVFTVTEFMIGDVTGNGTVSPYDATWVLDCVATELLGGTSVFPIETVAPPWSPVPLSSVDAREVADADGDGAITANDASVILQFVVGLVADLPAVVVPAPSADADAVGGALVVSPETMRPGGHITVSLDASRVPGLRSGELVLNFDPGLLRLAGVSLRARSDASRPLIAHRERDGRVAIAFASARPIAASDARVEVTFEAARAVVERSNGEIRASHLRLNGSLVETDFAHPFRIEPYRFQLMANYPNPFNPETWIPFELAEDSDVTVRVYGLDGEIVRTLDLGRRPTGEYRARERAAYWDGRNEVGERVASGLYVYELVAGERRAVRRMVIGK